MSEPHYQLAFGLHMPLCVKCKFSQPYIVDRDKMTPFDQQARRDGWGINGTEHTCPACMKEGRE